jgi:transposase
MACIELSDGEVAAIKGLIAHAGDPRHLRRALAILWLCRGDSPQEVADRLCVARSTVYNWAARYQDRESLDLAARVADGARSGRPRAEREEFV